MVFGYVFLCFYFISKILIILIIIIRKPMDNNGIFSLFLSIFFSISYKER